MHPLINRCRVRRASLGIGVAEGRGRAREVMRWGALALVGLLAGCAAFQPDTSLPVTVVASPNQDARHPTMVIIHYTTNDDADDSLATLTSQTRRVSAHYLIGPSGQLYQLVPENRRAWHAGQSYWAGMTDINSLSIGIEIDNRGEGPFAEAQIGTLLALLQDLRQRYRIKPENVLGHADVAPGRKVDPGAYFPWQRLATSGFGVWCDDPNVAYEGISSDLNTLLATLGYDPRLPDSSRNAFRSHYLAGADGTVSDDDDRLLRTAQCLVARKIGAPVAAPTTQPPTLPDDPAEMPVR